MCIFHATIAYSLSTLSSVLLKFSATPIKVPSFSCFIFFFVRLLKHFSFQLFLLILSAVAPPGLLYSEQMPISWIYYFGNILLFLDKEFLEAPLIRGLLSSSEDQGTLFYSYFADINLMLMVVVKDSQLEQEHVTKIIGILDYLFSPQSDGVSQYRI